MNRRRAEVARVISGMAGVFAVAVAVLLPFGFYAVGHGALEAATQMEADLKSEIVNPFIGANPELWRFGSDRLTDIVQRSSHVTGDEILRVLDSRDEEVVRIGGQLAAPLMVRSAALYDSGQRVGRLEVSRSLRPLLFKTLAMVVASSLVGAALFAVFRFAPMEVLTRALAELALDKQRAEVALHATGDAVIATDARGGIDYANPAAQLVTGYPPEALIGKGVDAALRPILTQAMAEKRVLKTPAGTLLARPDGTQIAVDCTASPICDAQGEVVGGVLVVRRTA